MKYEDIPEAIRQELFYDELVFGNAFCTKDQDGNYERIDPMKASFNVETKKWEITQ